MRITCSMVPHCRNTDNTRFWEFAHLPLSGRRRRLHTELSLAPPVPPRGRGPAPRSAPAGRAEVPDGAGRAGPGVKRGSIGAIIGAGSVSQPRDHRGIPGSIRDHQGLSGPGRCHSPRAIRGYRGPSGPALPVEKMGNSESNAYQNHLSRFLPEEQSDIDGLFETLSGSSGSAGAKNVKAAKKSVTLAALQAHTREPLPEPMTARLYNGMKSIDLPGKSSGLSEQIAKEQFVIFMSNLLKGNADEKISIIMRMIAKTGGPLKGKQILEFIEDLITSVVHVLSYRKELKGWTLENTRDSSSGVKALASELLSELRLPDGTKPTGSQLLETNFDQGVIEDWVYRVPQISVFLSVVIRQGLHVLHSLPDQTNDILNLVPHCKGIKGRGVVSLFDIPAIIYINSHLPAEMQHKWQLLFSSRLHGESFSQLCAHIVNKGPCIVIIRDLDGFLFGGFASHSWEVKPQFQGDNRCFLFSVFPTLAVYTYTGYNDHYMYLNHGQQTMPNGLGMGGQHSYFGLWIDSDYGKGHSKAKPRCTTYNSPQLSAKEDFTLDAMEVWAVGDVPESAGKKGKKSILDVDPQAQALLEMAGKSRQSEGLREPLEEDEDDDDDEN